MIAPRHACLACVEELGAIGAGLVLAGTLETFGPMYTTDSLIGDVEELQASVGEGPGVDALLSGRPVVVGDLSAPSSVQRWPLFAGEAARRGVTAMFSLPLALGAIQVGVLDLYRDTAGDLGAEQLVDALVYADTALMLVLDERSGIAAPVDAGSEASENGTLPALWHAEVHQAAGMVSIQLGVSIMDALVRLRAYAYRHDRRLSEVARAVVERRLRFPTPSGDMTSEIDGEGS